MGINRNDFVQTVGRRLRDIFQEYRSGRDVAPAGLFRLEGYIEAGCDAGLIGQQQAYDLIRSTWQEVLCCELPISAENTIQIPTAMQRAPVVPST